MLLKNKVKEKSLTKEEMQEKIKIDIEKIASEIIKIEKKPLLVLYYHQNNGEIKREDIEDLYGELRKRLKKLSTEIFHMYLTKI